MLFCYFLHDHYSFAYRKSWQQSKSWLIDYYAQWNDGYDSQVSKLKPILLVLIFNSLEIFNAISRTWVWLIPSVLLWRASPMEPYMGIPWFWMILIQTSCYTKSLKTSNYHTQVLIAMVSVFFYELRIVYNYLLFESEAKIRNWFQ